MPYIGNSPGTGTRNRFIFTATASQTTFSGADDNGKTLAYSDGDYVDVYLNGICLVPVDDYAATSKTSIVLTVGAAASDTLEVVAYDIATIADTVSKANGGTFEGEVNMLDTLTVGNDTQPSMAGQTSDFSIGSVGDDFKTSGVVLQRYQSANLSGPSILFGKSRGANIGDMDIVQDDDELGKIRFYGSDGSNMNSYGAEIEAFVDGTPGSGDMPGRLVFSTTADGSSTTTERMRIDSAGRVAIGATDPEAVSHGGKLKVRNDVDYGTVEVEDNSTLILQNENNTDPAAIVFHSNDSGGNSKRSGILGGYSTFSSGGLLLYGDISNKTITSGGTRPDILIKNNGYVGVNRIDLSYWFEVDSEGMGGAARFHRHTDGTQRGVVYFRSSSNGQTVGEISISNTSTAYNTSSDYRLKENVTAISDGITRVKQLSPKRFNFISEPDVTVDGFLAHEATTAVPEAVTGTHNETEAIGDITDGEGNTVETGVVEPNTLEEGQTWTETGTRPVYQSIDQSKLVPLLTAALQEAIAKIETLETKVAALEAN